jgi:transposase InsO family protein
MFHTDRGGEFTNQLLDETLATFKIIKTEFVYPTTFDSLEQLTIEFRDFVNWFHKFRIHGTLGCRMWESS